MTDTIQDAKSGAKDTARAVGSTAKERAGGVASTTGEEARAVANEARAHAGELVDQTRDQLRAQASEQTSRLSGTLRDIGDELHNMATGESAPGGPVADITKQLAAAAHKTSARLEVGGVDGAMADLKRFARNRPGMFLLGALGAGFAVGRLVKAVDTHAVMDAAKSGAGMQDDTGDASYERDMYGSSGTSGGYRTEPGAVVGESTATPGSMTPGSMMPPTTAGGPAAAPPTMPYADPDVSREVP
jgi:hypothetical protein